MGQEIEVMTSEDIIENFPLLADDVDFKITSKSTPDYNCIAWAYHFQNRWMWPGGQEEKSYDGFLFWPDGVADSEDVSAFIEAFVQKGYLICDSDEHEEGYQKIALYTKQGTTICTHAARELHNGCWTSKLGAENDIQHGSPYTIEGDIYGEVYCIMKREFK